MAGGGALHREMAGRIRIAGGGVIKQAHIGQNNGIHTDGGRAVDGTLPVFPAIGLGVGVNGTKDTGASGVSILDAFGGSCFIEVQAGKLAGIGAVAKTEVDRVSTMVNSGPEGRQAASGTDKFHDTPP